MAATVGMAAGTGAAADVARENVYRNLAHKVRSPRVRARRALAHQTIDPYTDLLHDMGPGLADGRPDFEASGSEWRTAPLWGIGLVKTVNEHTRFLHDGRPRNVSEAILWHGGEAEKAKDNFRKMRSIDRKALLAYLDAL